MPDENPHPSLIDSLNCNLLNLTIGYENILLTITYGKIRMWLGRRAERGDISRIMHVIRTVDPKLTCEMDLLAEFPDIERMAGRGLNLLSYRRKGDKYRAIFNAPLIKEEVLECLLDSIDHELEMSDIEKTILWEADDEKIRLLLNKLNASGIAKSINISTSDD
ncbi:MAG: hypothetical protein ACXQS6_04375 [Candidatus Syntropharchaeales archaeon]